MKIRLCISRIVCVCLVFFLSSVAVTAQTAQEMREQLLRLQSEAATFRNQEQSAPQSEKPVLMRKRKLKNFEAAELLSEYLKKFDPASKEYAELLFRLVFFRYFSGDDKRAFEAAVETKHHVMVRNDSAMYKGQPLKGILSVITQDDINQVHNEEVRRRTLEKIVSFGRV